MPFMQTDQGIKNMPVDEAARIAGTDPDYSLRDLYENIAQGKFVSYIPLAIVVA